MMEDQEFKKGVMVEDREFKKVEDQEFKKGVMVEDREFKKGEDQEFKKGVMVEDREFKKREDQEFKKGVVVEDGEFKKGEINNGLIPPSPLSPPSKLVASAPLLLYQKKKKTRDLSNCHSCGLRVPSDAPRGQLRTLRSQWRIVLLCNGCLAAVSSADACSYCFSKIAGDTEHAPLDCRQCRRRVHLRCVPQHHPYLPPSRLSRDSFACIDCCPLLKPRDRAASSVSLEDAARDASSVFERKAAAATRAKEHAVQKAVAARRATALARNALDAVLAVKEPAVVPDEELALQLHLAMNGSHRILRNLSSRSSDCLVGLKKVRGGDDSVGRDDESENYGICVKAEVCTEDHFTFDMVERTGFPQDMPVGMAVKEEQGSCSERVANSGGDDYSIGSASTSCQRPNELNGSDGSQQKVMGSAPDRYLKKYSSKRHWRFEGTRDTRVCPIVPCWQMKSCSQPPGIAVHPSTCTSDLSSCQS